MPLAGLCTVCGGYHETEVTVAGIHQWGFICRGAVLRKPLANGHDGGEVPPVSTSFNADCFRAFLAVCITCGVVHAHHREVQALQIHFQVMVQTVFRVYVIIRFRMKVSVDVLVKQVIAIVGRTVHRFVFRRRGVAV